MLQMNTGERRAIDLLARLAVHEPLEDRPNTLAGVAEDCHGTYCVCCGRRAYKDRLWPDHRDDCPLEQGQRFPQRTYGDRGAEPGEIAEVSGFPGVSDVPEAREIQVHFPG